MLQYIESTTDTMHSLQKAISQIGIDAVQKSLIPLGARIGRCDMHGSYLIMPGAEPSCPLCPPTPPANGETASDVELYIDMDPIHNLGTNPQQKINLGGNMDGQY